MANSIGEKTRFYSLTGLLNIAVGVMFYTINITPTPVLASPASLFRPAVVKAISATQGVPIRIVIPSLLIDLPVDVGTYNQDSGSWTVDATRAYYADASMPVNNSNGLTLIYGHAQSSVFETLPQIQPDAEALIYTNTGYIFHYRHTSVRVVQPTDVSVFTPNGPPKLVLQTCTGVYSELRALYSFKLTSIDIL